MKNPAREMGSSAAVEAIMSVYYNAVGSNEKRKNIVQPVPTLQNFPRSQFEFEANLIDWTPEWSEFEEPCYDGEWTNCGYCGHEVPSQWDHCNECGRLLLVQV